MIGRSSQGLTEAMRMGMRRSVITRKVSPCGQIKRWQRVRDYYARRGRHAIAARASQSLSASLMSWWLNLSIVVGAAVSTVMNLIHRDNFKRRFICCHRKLARNRWTSRSGGSLWLTSSLPFCCSRQMPCSVDQIIFASCRAAVSLLRIGRIASVT